MDNDWKVNPETQTLSSACVLLYLLLETFLLRLQFVQHCYLHILTELTCAFFVCLFLLLIRYTDVIKEQFNLTGK